MPPTTATQGPEGHHAVESTDPPETAARLGLTRAAAAAGRATGPEPVATVPPPVFRPSNRRRPAAPASNGPESPGDGGPDSRPDFSPDASDATSSTTTGSSSRASTSDPDGGASPRSWRERFRGAGQSGRPAGAEPVRLRDIPQLTDGIAQAFHAVGDELNDRVAPGTELFLTDDADERGFAEPAARLILRRMPADLAAAGNPDFADVIAAGIVLARYAVKQLNVMRALRRAQRAAGEQGRVPYGTPPAADNPSEAAA